MKILKFLFLLILTSTFCTKSLAQSYSCKKERLLKKSLKFFKTEPRKAGLLIEKAIRKDPGCPLSYLHMASLVKTSQPSKALKYYDLAILNGADSTTAFSSRDSVVYLLAISKYESGELIDAIGFFKQLELNSNFELTARNKKYKCLLQLSDRERKVGNNDLALNYLNLILSENLRNVEALQRKIEILEGIAKSQYDFGNNLESLNTLSQITDYYRYLNLPISCEHFALRANIHFELQRKEINTIKELKSRLILLEDLLVFPENCPGVQRIQGLATKKKKEIWKILSRALNEREKPEEAYGYIVKLMPTKDKEIIELYNNILINLASSAYSTDRFDESIYLLEKINSAGKELKTPKFLQLYSKIKLAYAEYLSKRKKTEPTLRQAIILCDELIRNKNFLDKHVKAKKLRKGLYLDLIKILRKKSDHYELLDYINRLHLEYPGDVEVQNLRATLILDFGINVNTMRYYEVASIYYSEAQKSTTKYSAIATYYLAKLYATAFKLDIASGLMKKAINELSKNNHYLVPKTKNAFYSYQSILQNDAIVINYLYQYYCSSDYSDIRAQIKKDNSYYNMQENPRFMRWINGIRRLKISGLCGEIDFNPDRDETGDWFAWKGPDMLAEIFGSKTNFVKGDYSPCWGNWSAVRDFRVDYHNSTDISLYDYDPKILGGNEFEYIGTLETKNLCKVGRHFISSKTKDGNVHIGYSLSDASDAPYTNSYIYGEKSGLQIGFELSLCVLKKMQGPGTFFLVSLAEDILVEKSIENNESAIENAIVGTMISTAKGVLPSEIRQTLRAFGITKCFYQGINELEKSGWVKENYTEEGKRIVSLY